MSHASKTKLAVTGASGFIARGVLEMLAEGTSVRALSRGNAPAWAGGRIDWITLTSYTDVQALSSGLQDVDYVLHLADNPLRNQDRDKNTSVQIAVALIEAMQRKSVKGAIIASSVYAKDAGGLSDESYGAAKAAMERKFLSASAPRTVVLRLPPVYGPGGRGGMATLAKLAKLRIPLPVGLARAPRAYLSRRNLATLVSCLIHASETAWENAAGRIFEPSDGVDVSTRELVQFMADQMRISVSRIPLPLALLRALGMLTGRSEIIAGAIDPLEVADPTELGAAFGWRPVEHMPESLAFLRQEFRSG